MEKNALSKIETHIQTMKTAHAALANTSDIDMLFQIIHRPGWTTLAEGSFLLAALESINTQTAQLAALRQNVLAAAQQVGAAQAAGV
ncbi:MAG TPA: hypothetical protein VKH15_11425 [Candidatus Acidoferrum sp.]|nr:hypothetical protein [Candidatus Acidoferrum sp.]